MKYHSIASGSTGNRHIVSCNGIGVLIDAGIAFGRINVSLDSLRILPRDISSVFVTHEHQDHIYALDQILKRTNWCIYATQVTAESISCWNEFNEQDRLVLINPCKSVTVGNIQVTPLPISHDVKEPVGYLCVGGEKKLLIGTDMGHVSSRSGKTFTQPQGS